MTSDPTDITPVTAGQVWCANNPNGAGKDALHIESVTGDHAHVMYETGWYGRIPLTVLHTFWTLTPATRLTPPPQ